MAKKDKSPQVTLIDARNGLVLAERFRPDLSRPLPHLDRPGARAYAVDDALDNAEEFFCALCEPECYIRHETITALAEANPRKIRLPHAAAPIRLEDGRHFFAIVFDKARSRPLPAVYGDGVLPERDLVQRILPGLIRCLLDMGPRGIAHRNIRPENILIDPEGGASLDECVIGLPGEAQQDVYEPVASALAIPGGRGEGVVSDDYYALGVTTLHLISGKLPGQGIEAADLLARRIVRGSYITLLNRRKFSSPIQALLSGTLIDEAHRRWTADDLKAWAAGHWDMARPTASSRRAPRPFFFMNRDYHNPELLAWSFQENPLEAAKAIASRRVEKWVRNVLEDSQAADQIENSSRIFEPKGEEVTDDTYELVARVSLALDPAGPLRYRTLVITPSGIAGAIWTAFATQDEERLEELNALMMSGLLSHWQSTGSRGVRAALPLFVTTTIKSIMVERERAGFGLERVLYEMLPRVSCLASGIRAACALSLGDVLLALDRLAERDPSAALEVGRHVAAFVLAKDKSVETTVRALAGPHPTRAEALTAQGDFLAYLQRNYLHLQVPTLTRELGKALAPAAEDIRSRLRRMVLVQKIETLSEGGDLTALVKELDIRQTLARDKAERVQAKHRLKSLEGLIELAGSDGTAQTLLAQRRGFRYARLFSTSVAFLTAFYFAMFEML